MTSRSKGQFTSSQEDLPIQGHTYRLEKRKFDLEKLKLAVEGTTLLIILIGAFVGFQQLREDRNALKATIENEGRRIFHNEKFQFYSEIARNVSILAQPTDTQKGLESDELKKNRGEAERSFWKLYWGKMILLEPQPIETEMINFGMCLEGQESEKQESYCKDIWTIGRRLICFLRFDLDETLELNLGTLSGTCGENLKNDWQKRN